MRRKREDWNDGREYWEDDREEKRRREGKIGKREEYGKEENRSWIGNWDEEEENGRREDGKKRRGILGKENGKNRRREEYSIR